MLTDPAATPVSFKASSSFGPVYHELCTNLMTGPQVDVRGLLTKELIGSHFQVDPLYPLCLRPGFSHRFALTETLQVICGRGDMRQLKKLAPAFEGMAPSYVTYGPRLAWQLQAVFDRLLADWTSRQAIATVYMPEDFHKGYPDCPCTMSLQFLVRLDDAQVPRVHLICTMRSNDIWYGTPTDIFMFTFLQRQMAASLGYEVGHYVHQAGSIHVYEEHWEKVIQMLATPTPLEFPKPELARYPGYSWDKVRVKAAEWLDGSIKGKTWVRGLDL